MINNFLQGALCEAVSNNYDAVFIPSTYPARQQLEALAVDKSGDVAFQAGRVTGAAANVAQGIIEMGVGAGAMVAGLGGGALTSPSGGGALAGARVAVAGAAVAGHGLLVGAKGMEGAMEGFSNVLNATAGGGRSFRSLGDAQGEIGKWGVEDNLARSDSMHLDAVRRERLGEQLSRKPGGHIDEVRGARRGLA